MADITLTPVSAETINDNFDAIEDAVNAKAELNGDSTEKFEVADAVAQTEAINKKQLDNAVSSINSTISDLETDIETELAAKLDASDTTVTKQGNTFNGAGQLVQLNSSGQLPALDGHLLTGIAAATFDTSNMPLLSNNSTDANNDIDISSGFCWDDALAVKLQLSSTFTKQLDAAWASGTNAGGLDTGSKAVSTWYHVFLISNGTNTDVMFSTSQTSPIMPSGYTSKRRIGSIKTDASGNILGFLQDADIFNYNTFITELYSTLIVEYTDLILSVPPKTKALLQLEINRSASQGWNVLLIRDKIKNSTYGGTIMADCNGESNLINPFPIPVDDNSKIQYSTSGATLTAVIYTFGYIDKRGKN